ncbi:hypothetical protein V6N11_018067 [Hibiscus sabdariffa]|uniref:Uncharacterized protein n=1 Tax=Hibiscus sabdariffa TaxID=183260 RepID=A0ABR2T6A7_9ROSI
MKMMAELLEKKKGKNLQLTKKAKEAISALITVDKRDGSGNGWKVASGPSANDTIDKNDSDVGGSELQQGSVFRGGFSSR